MWKSTIVCRFKPMVGLAATATDVECPEPAAKLLGAVDELLLRRGVKLYPWERPIYARAESMARSLLGQECLRPPSGRVAISTSRTS